MSHRERTFLAFFVIISSIIAVYANSFTASWHLDDDTSIIQNSRIHLQELSLSNLKEVAYPTVQGAPNDRPVAYLSFALNWYFFQDNVFGYHFFNVLVHAGSSFLLFFIIITLYKTKRLRGHNKKSVFYVALLTSLLWALNPIQTQAVTYIVQRMASLAAFFYLAGLLCYLRGRLTKKATSMVLNFVIAGGMFLLALGTKQNSVIFPVALLLIELIFLQQCKRLMRVNTITLCLFSLLLAGVSFFILDFVYDLRGQAFSHRSFTLYERILTEPRVLLMYLSQILYPVADRFSVLHDIEISKTIISPILTLPSIIIVCGMIVFAIAKRNCFPIVSFAILFYFSNHAVESTFLNLELMFEHRNYLPSTFVFWPVASFVVEGVQQRWKRNRVVAVMLSLVAVVCLASSGRWTYQRNNLWQTEELLWGDVLKKAPGLARPYLALAAASSDKGQDELALKLYNDSLVRKDASPRYAQFLAYHNMGYVYFLRGDWDNAEIFFSKALEMEPDNRLAYYNLVHSLVKAGRFEEAGDLLDRAMANSVLKDSEEMLAMQGFVLLQTGYPAEAVNFFRAAYFSGNLNGKYRVAQACAFMKSGKYIQAAVLLESLETMWLSLGERSPVLGLLGIENALLAGDLQKAKEVCLALISQYPLEVISDSLSLAHDDLPLNIDLLRPFLQKNIESTLVGHGF